MTLKPKQLSLGDVIAIIAPSMAFTKESYQMTSINLSSIGFIVKPSQNLFKTTYGFAASTKERASDFNSMVLDDNVKMILFGGGEVSNEILPYLNFDEIKNHPKIICSYSDSTTILNAITSLTGLVTFYGQSPRTFFMPTEYNLNSFYSCFMKNQIPSYYKSGSFRTIHNGMGKGTLIGGYLANFALMLNSNYLNLNKDTRYILFIEDYIKFNTPPALSKYISHIEQSGFFSQVDGLLFGHYSDDAAPLLDDILKRIGDRYDIPVVRCDDFGHGINNAIIPIGITTTLDADKQSIQFHETLMENT